MPERAFDRRRFMKRALLASGGAVVAASHEEKALMAQAANPPAKPVRPPSPAGLPTGTLGTLKVSRLICGGNLISGFAHSRDLMYVSPLLKHYFTDEKVLETLALCEEQGINTAILRVDAHTLRIIKAHWAERGGALQWIAQAKITTKDRKSDIDKAVDAGAVAVYIHGGVGDRFVQEGRVDLLGEAVEYIKQRGVVSGLAAHGLDTLKAYERAKIAPDFYMKTLNAKNYWSAGRMPRNDSVWSETPEQTIAFMRTIQRPWIAYKVLGAGAIHPKEGFRSAYENRADFICAGMFDFQVTEDVIIARRALAATRKRERSWRS